MQRAGCVSQAGAALGTKREKTPSTSGPTCRFATVAPHLLKVTEDGNALRPCGTAEGGCATRAFFSRPHAPAWGRMLGRSERVKESISRFTDGRILMREAAQRRANQGIRERRIQLFHTLSASDCRRRDVAQVRTWRGANNFRTLQALMLTRLLS